MATCKHCNTTEGIVYSGTDAFLLGCLDSVENICYPCANDKDSRNV